MADPQQQQQKQRPPQAAPTADEVATLRNEVRELKDALVSALAARPHQDLAERVDRVERINELRPEDKAAWERRKHWLGLSAQDKSRLQVLARWGHEAASLPWFAVSLHHVKETVGGKAKTERVEAWPVIELPAHSEEVARARYAELTTIRLLNNDHVLVAEKLPGRPEWAHLNEFVVRAA